MFLLAMQTNSFLDWKADRIKVMTNWSNSYSLTLQNVQTRFDERVILFEQAMFTKCLQCLQCRPIHLIECRSYKGMTTDQTAAHQEYERYKQGSIKELFSLIKGSRGTQMRKQHLFALEIRKLLQSTLLKRSKCIWGHQKLFLMVT